MMACLSATVIKPEGTSAMTLKVRRIVARHDEFGGGSFVSDEKLTTKSRGMGANGIVTSSVFTGQYLSPGKGRAYTV